MSQLDEYKRSKLHYLCIDYPEGDRVRILKEIVESGEDVNLKDKNGWSPLHFAAQEGDSIIAKELIDLGADIAAAECNGNTPLWVATMNSNSSNKLIHVLLEAGADPDKENNHGVSPMEISPELFKNGI